MIKKTTIWTIVIAVIIVLALGYVFWNNTNTPTTGNVITDTNTPTNTNPNPSTTTNMPTTDISLIGSKNIGLTSQGFSEATVTINVGDTITWTNQDSSSSHTITSDRGNELSSKILETGQSFSHTFNTAGEFGYHSEVNPRLKGTVIVQ